MADLQAAVLKPMVSKTAYSTGVNYDHVFSPTLFTEARVGVAHLRNNATPINYGFERRNHSGCAWREHRGAAIH